MRTTAPLLLILMPLAGCGPQEEACQFEPLSFLFDGAETSGRCSPVSLRVNPEDGYVRGTLAAGTFGDQPQFQIDFQGGELPNLAALQIQQATPAESPSASAIFWFHDETGPLRATSGEVALSVEGEKVIVEVEGLIARRDGIERPFTARLEGMLVVSCWGCTQAPCAEEARSCEPFLALSGWKDPRH